MIQKHIVLQKEIQATFTKTKSFSLYTRLTKLNAFVKGNNEITAIKYKIKCNNVKVLYNEMTVRKKKHSSIVVAFTDDLIELLFFLDSIN